MSFHSFGSVVAMTDTAHESAKLSRRFADDFRRAADLFCRAAGGRASRPDQTP
jgi:hypothetical protein